MSSEQADRLTSHLLDSKCALNLDGLLDGVIALWNDCNNPVLKKTHRNIETFLDRNAKTVQRLLECRISPKNFDLIKVIGRGAFGEVQLVRNAQNRKVYAMKLLEKEKMNKRTDAAFFWEERDIMAYSESDWIVKLHYAFQDQRHLYMVMEFMPGGDLVNLMANHDIPEDWVRFYTAELVLALSAIHSMGYIHRDVKPDNMLIAASGHIKLADFGTCVKMNPDGQVRCCSAVGTPDYISPEVLRSQGDEGVFGREVDWWAVGVTMYEMLVGETPFYSDSLVTTYQRIMEHGSNLKFPDDVHMSAEAKDIVRKFIQEPAVRLGKGGVAAIKSHPFFRNPKWTFENIKTAKPPYIPQLVSDDDTSHFDDVEPVDQINLQSFTAPKAFSGNELPFIGFTYSSDFGPLEVIRKRVTAGCQNGQLLNGGGGINGLADVREEIAANNRLNEIEEVRLEAEVLGKRMAMMQQQMDEKEELAQKENGALKRDKDYLEIRTNELKGQMDKIKMDNESIRNEKKQLEVQVAELKSRVNELAPSKHEVEQLKEQLSALELQSQRYKEQLDQATNSSNHAHHVSRHSSDLPQQQQQPHLSAQVQAEMKFERRVMENKLKDLQEQLETYRRQVADFQQRLEAEQKLSELYKLEIEARDRDNVEREKRLQAIPLYEQQLEELRQTLDRERGSHRLMENSFMELQREKSLLEAEMREMMHRHEDEYKAINGRIQAAAQRESDLLAQVRQLEAEVVQFRKHSHGPMGLAPVSGATSGLSSAMSTSSLASNSASLNSGLHNTHSTSGDLEKMTKEQLIQRCQREIQMKEQVVAKLAYLGRQKGINDESAEKAASTKKKKKRDEERRVRDMVEFQMNQERRKYEHKFSEMDNNIQFMHEQLYEEQSKNSAIVDELNKYKQHVGELPDTAHNPLMPREPRRVPPRRLREQQLNLENVLQ